LVAHLFNFAEDTAGSVAARPNNPFLQRRIDAAKHAVRVILDCAQDLRYVDSAGLIALSLHGSAIELMGGCIVLAEDMDHAIGIPILLRSMKAACIDLENLLLDRAYLENIEAANLKQTLKLLDAAAADNPLLAGLVEGRTDEHNEHRARYDALLAAGRRSLNIDERFRKAGRQNEYNSIYAYLCLDAHNNIAALAERHIGDGADELPQVSIFQQPDPTVIGRRLGLGTWMLLDSATSIHSAFQVRQQDIQALSAQLQDELARQD
jgi:hypothetical protein